MLQLLLCACTRLLHFVRSEHSCGHVLLEDVRCRCLSGAERLNPMAFLQPILPLVLLRFCRLASIAFVPCSVPANPAADTFWRQHGLTDVEMSSMLMLCLRAPATFEFSATHIAPAVAAVKHNFALHDFYWSSIHCARVNILRNRSYASVVLQVVLCKLLLNTQARTSAHLLLLCRASQLAIGDWLIPLAACRCHR